MQGRSFFPLSISDCQLLPPPHGGIFFSPLLAMTRTDFDFFFVQVGVYGLYHGYYSRVCQGGMV
jgi:hypothetical protein